MALEGSPVKSFDYQIGIKMVITDVFNELENRKFPIDL